MATANDLIKLALKQVGVIAVGETAAAEDVNDALTLLNSMLGQWSRKRWLTYHLQETAVVGTGALSYTVGIGGAFNITQPDRLEDAFVRLLNTTGTNQVDYPLTILESRQDYDQIALKSLQSLPQFVFYDANYPMGNLYVWPLPTSLYEVHILTKAPLNGFTALSQVINIAPEYMEALYYNLACRLRAQYRLPPDDSLVGLARAALATIRAENTAIPNLRIPQTLLGIGGRYNIYSDNN
jgi:hypothetical protein